MTKGTAKAALTAAGVAAPEYAAVLKAEREAMRAVLIAKSKDKTLNDKQKIALLMEAFFGVKE